jgi:hypothetical protein
MKRLIHCALAIALGGGCAGPESGTQTVTATASPLTVSTGAGSEFRHTTSASLFHTGEVVGSKSEGGFEKLVGKDGVFAIEEANGWSLALPNGGSSAETAPPLTNNADEHNARVVEYFKAAGLPASEIGSVHVNTMMRGGRAATGPRTADKFVGYISVIQRRIQGIAVPDSFAWARLNAKGEVVAESVYWPAIPAATVTEAVRLQQHLAEATKQKDFVASLAASDPTIAADATAEVTIHHSSATVHAAPVAVAAVDLMTGRQGDERRRVRHFSAAGAEIVLAHERAQSAPTAPVRTPKP